MTEPPPEDDPPEESPNGQGEESDTVQSVARVKDIMVKNMVALRRYIMMGEQLSNSRRSRVSNFQNRKRESRIYLIYNALFLLVLV